jgi:hypothetical protein
VQNRMFQQQAEDHDGSVLRTPGAGASGATKAASAAPPAPGVRPKLTLIRTPADEPDLSRLKATPGFVFRRGPRQR